MMPGEEPLASSGHFEYHDRQRHDSFWGGLYATALAVTVFGGLYGSVHRCLYSLCCISLLPILLSTLQRARPVKTVSHVWVVVQKPQVCTIVRHRSAQ